MTRRMQMPLLLVFVVLCLPLARAQQPNIVALTGGMLISGLEVPPVHHATIVIEADKIVQAGPAVAVSIPPGATVIDTSGQTMLPGLIDDHVHLIIVGAGDYPRWFDWMKAHRAEYPPERIMAISAYQLLMSGVTSAIDLGGPLEPSLAVRDRINRGEIPGPRMLVSGPWLTRHVAIFPAEYQIDVTSPEQAAQAVDRLAKAGVDVIKAHAGLTLQDYRAIVAAAHAHGLKVHAHVYEEQAVRDAFEAGVDVLEHAGSAGVPTYSPDLVHAIAASGRPVVLTVAHRSWVWPATVDFPERLQDPQLRSLFPSDLWQEVQHSFDHWQSLSYFATVGRQMHFRDALLEQWLRSGATLGMGTDNGTPMNFHTDALWREMKVFVDHGVPPLEVIADATRVNARIMGKGEQLGTIEPGKLADVIVVDGNPLFDIGNLSHIEVAIKGGVVYKRNGHPTPGIPH